MKLIKNIYFLEILLILFQCRDSLVFLHASGSDSGFPWIFCTARHWILLWRWWLNVCFKGIINSSLMSSWIDDWGWRVLVSLFLWRRKLVTFSTITALWLFDSCARAHLNLKLVYTKKVIKLSLILFYIRSNVYWWNSIMMIKSKTSLSPILHMDWIDIILFMSYRILQSKSILLCILIIEAISQSRSNCGGNCPSNSCYPCFCGTQKNIVNTTEICSKY